MTAARLPLPQRSGPAGLSAFDLFKVGIGPSSSHTVGPMRAAKRFVDQLAADGVLRRTDRVQVELFGSLGATGHGHGTPKAVVLGLQGEDPATVDTETAEARAAEATATGRLLLHGSRWVPFDRKQDLILHRRRSLPGHPNGMVFRAWRAGTVVRERTYYSVGGGFVVDAAEDGPHIETRRGSPVPFPFTTAEHLLAVCRAQGLRISDVMLANEQSWREEEEIRAGLLALWSVMADCVAAGCRNDGVLPGGLGVRRRAPALFQDLVSGSGPGSGSGSGSDAANPLRVMDWVNLFALAVNEENAAGGRVVTAPTNGAAGIVPAVLHYYLRFVAEPADRPLEEIEDAIVRFLLTAAAIGILFKVNASISGAEVGCQGEVGSACAMAAGALCEVLGGSAEQVENAAEIGIEHNLGLTCDPVGGLVQIPCIERNAIASVKAVNAARLALNGDGSHRVSLDQAIDTMRETGRDMNSKYKETARGGLAVNVIEC